MNLTIKLTNIILLSLLINWNGVISAQQNNITEFITNPVDQIQETTENDTDLLEIVFDSISASNSSSASNSTSESNSSESASSSGSGSSESSSSSESKSSESKGSESASNNNGRHRWSNRYRNHGKENGDHKREMSNKHDEYDAYRKQKYEIFLQKIFQAFNSDEGIQKLIEALMQKSNNGLENQTAEQTINPNSMKKQMAREGLGKPKLAEVNDKDINLDNTNPNSGNGHKQAFSGENNKASGQRGNKDQQGGNEQSNQTHGKDKQGNGNKDQHIWNGQNNQPQSEDKNGKGNKDQQRGNGQNNQNQRENKHGKGNEDQQRRNAPSSKMNQAPVGNKHAKGNGHQVNDQIDVGQETTIDNDTIYYYEI